MARLRSNLIVALLGTSLAGCYLFSDEPKARKTNEDKPAEPSEPAADATTDTPSGEPAGEGSVEDCPAALTGAETRARVISAACGPVIVRGQYQIDGGSLTLQAGATLLFEAGAVLEVGRNRAGTLIVEGSVEQPVQLRAEPSAGEGWSGVRLHGQAAGSKLKHLQIDRAGEAERAALWIAAEQVEIEALQITGAKALALELAAERGVEVRGAKLPGKGVIVRATPEAAGGLHDLALDPGAKVAITAGRISADTSWAWAPLTASPEGVTSPIIEIDVEGFVRIEGTELAPATLTLAPNSSLRFDDEARLIVGSFQPGALVAEGREDAPIRLLARAGERAGAWPGVHVQERGEAKLTHVELSQGGARDEGVILAEGAARLAIESCRFVDDAVGVELRGNAVVLDRFTGNAFERTPVALRSTAQLLGSLGSDNRYDGEARIHVERGKVERDTRWIRQDAPLIVHGDVFVDRGATLTLEAGLRVTFDAGVKLGVGYYEEATLELLGQRDAVIELGPADPASAWVGVVLATHSKGSRFEHVRLTNTSGAGGIELQESAAAMLVDVECTDCAGATVTWDCASKVGNADVRAAGTTPTALAAPQGC